MSLLLDSLGCSSNTYESKWKQRQQQGTVRPIQRTISVYSLLSLPLCPVLLDSARFELRGENSPVRPSSFRFWPLQLPTDKPDGRFPLSCLLTSDALIFISASIRIDCRLLQAAANERATKMFESLDNRLPYIPPPDYSVRFKPQPPVQRRPQPRDDHGQPHHYQPVGSLLFVSIHSNFFSKSAHPNDIA